MLSKILLFGSRTYGRWVARNPTIVLCSSLAIVILLSLGLLRFKVETQPEKVSPPFASQICCCYFSEDIFLGP